MIPAAPGTIRPGGHWRVTIVDEGVQPPDATGHRPDAQLLAVVMAGKVLTTDPELAERICALLNGADEVRRTVESWTAPRPTAEAPATVRKVRPVDGDAPSRPLSAPVAAQEAPVGGTGPSGGVETISGDPAITEGRCCRKCGAAVESVTAEPHTEEPHSSGLYMVAMSIARTLHPCGHGYIQATGAVT